MDTSHETNETVPAAMRLDARTAILRMLRKDKLVPTEIAGLFDCFRHAERVAAVRSLGKKEQSALWVAVEGAGKVTLTDIVPATRATDEEVRHFGKNSLPMFTHFEKRFLRPSGQDAAHPTELHGYNYQASAVGTWFSGPGYFVATEDAARGEVLIDYRRVPESHPPTWPKIRDNEHGGASLVYGFMVDTLRRVSSHVTIGRANKRGKDMDAWFLLCRDASDTEPAEQPQPKVMRV